jgi:Type II secretion system (T2SS), protein E, N-terminal domain
MRPTDDTATALEAHEAPLLAFGNGLRDRLQVVRALEVARAEQARPPARRDISPELMLVSPDPDPDYGNSLAAALLERVGEARRAPLGMLLAEAGLLTAGEIHFALARAQESGRRLGEVLVEHGFVTPADIVRVVAEQRGLPFLDVRTVAVDPAAAKLLPEDLARLFRTLPVGFVRGLPVVAVADPTDDDAMHGAQSVLHTVRFIASPEDAILAQLARVYVNAA